MMNTEYKTKEELNIELQNLEKETELKFHQDFSNFYDEMNRLIENGSFHFEDDHFSRKAHGKALIMHEAVILAIFLQTKPQIKKEKFL